MDHVAIMRKLKIKIYKLRFRETNRNIFNAIKIGKKKVETRAATFKYSNMRVGDKLIFICGKSKFMKSIKQVRKFKSLNLLCKKYKPSAINPTCKTKKELEKMYYSFPNYKEKIKKFGIIALKLN